MTQSLYPNLSYSVNVYKMWFTDKPDHIYIGSTRNAISQAVGHHRKMAQNGDTSPIHQTMREKGVKSVKYALLGSYTVNTKEEQLLCKHQWIDNMKPTLNTIKESIAPPPTLSPFAFIDDLKEVGSFTATSLYNKYIEWCADKNIIPITSTKFGIIVGGKLPKRRTKNGIKYTLPPLSLVL